MTKLKVSKGMKFGDWTAVRQTSVKASCGTYKWVWKNGAGETMHAIGRNVMRNSTMETKPVTVSEKHYPAVERARQLLINSLSNHISVFTSAINMLETEKVSKSYKNSVSKARQMLIASLTDHISAFTESMELLDAETTKSTCTRNCCTH